MSRTSRTPVEESFEEDFHKFIRQKYSTQISEVVTTDRGAIEIDIDELLQFDIDLVDEFWSKPDRVRGKLESALHTFDSPAGHSLEDVSVRIVGFDEEETNQVGSYESGDIGTHQAIQGQVAKTSAKMPVFEMAAFECLRCGTVSEVPQTNGDDLQDPHQCKGCERDGPFQLVIERSELHDQQQVRLQQPPEEVKRGSGSTIDIVVNNDLVNEVNPGDRAMISGKLDLKSPEESPEYTLRGQAVRVEDSDYDQTDIRNHLDEIHAIIDGDRGDPYQLLVDSIAPRIHGEEYDEIKLALALQMFAANEIEYADGGRSRGRFHVLLLGDPGVGKSRLVEAVDELAPRSVYTSGEGVTKAGMTAAVVRDDFGDSQWSLEAGPVVEANDGICCVDEIDKADEEAVEGLHTALEKQVVTVNKASFTGVELQARTSLLAAGNPSEGRFDPFGNIPEQIDLSPTLLSRFDLMFMMEDQPDPENDQKVIEQMIEDRQDGIRYDRGDISADEAASDPPVEPDTLQAWIAYVYEKDPKPSIEDPELKEHIVDFVNDLRSAGEGDDLDNQVPITFRKVEAIMRLAEASARIRLSKTVEQEDVRRATQLVLRSMRDVEYDPETGTFDADIVETGQSRSQKKRYETAKRYIRQMSSDGHNPSKQEIIDALVTEGYAERKAEKTFENLKTDGTIYEAQDGGYRYFDA